METRLLLYSFLVLGCSSSLSGAVGCENDPCEHLCTDTIDSFYCECFPNYILQDDQTSCKNEKNEAVSSLYLGCYEDDEEEPDFKYLIWTRSDATVLECIRSCSARAFLYAGLQGGDECWCDNSYWRRYNETDTCTSLCEGTDTEMCGGRNALSVYTVPIDERYEGCWYEDLASREMDYLLWDRYEEKSPSECIDGCSLAGYNYAAVYYGGDCYCGNAYGSFGHAPEETCNEPCLRGYSLANCGGNETNAIYRVVRGVDLTDSGDVLSGRFGTIYFGEFLYDYPNLQGILSRRMITYASRVVNIPGEDVECFNENCYGVCGTIAQPDGYDTLNQVDMVIRDWHIKITDVMPKYIDGKSYVPERVHIFAQTLVIDGSVNFPFSVYMRARQIIIDYSVQPSITFDHNGPELSINVTEAVTYGPPSDLAFQKLSVLCARMLFGTDDEKSNQLAQNIIDDIFRDRAYSEEQQHYMDSVRAIRSNVTSIGRNDLRWVPYYSRNYYTSVLDTYSVELESYADQYEALLQDYEDCELYKSHASQLLGIWTSTVMTRSEILREDAKDALEISEATYIATYTEFNVSRTELAEAEETFEEGLDEWEKEQSRRAMRKYLRGAQGIRTGVFPLKIFGLEDDFEAIMGVCEGLKLLEETMEDLARTVYELEQFLTVADAIIATGDYNRYMDNIESVAQLYPMIVEWDNYKYQIDVIFRHPEFRNIKGAIEYSFALIDFCNWGQALTKATTEYANMLREYAKFDAIHKANEDMLARYQEYFDELGEACETKGLLAVAFYEQNYDMMLVANDLLLQFCDSYFYELLESCPTAAAPKFDADLRNLVLQIDRALFEASDYQRRSSANIQIDIEDPADVAANCSDPTICPVKVFRETGNFIYTMPLDERRLQGVDLFLISELFIQFPGTITTDPTKNDFRLDVSKQGPFRNRLRGEVFEFYTRGLTSMTYQYNIQSRVTELSCDLIEQGGTSGYMIQQAAPFTTWHIKIDSYSAGYIDVSNVEYVNFTLAGSYLNTFEDIEHVRDYPYDTTYTPVRRGESLRGRGEQLCDG